MTDGILQELLPRAVVSIAIRRLLGLASAARAADGAVLFATATMDGRFLGRTVPFSGTDELSLGDVFQHTVVPVGDRTIEVRVELFRADGDPKEQHKPVQVLAWSLAPPWTSGRFTSSSDGLRFEVSVVTKLVPSAARRAVAARTIEGTKTQSTIALQDALVAVFADVEGLYQLDPSFSLASATRRVPGYASEDHEGRVFVCHDRSGKRIKEGQSILAVVRVLAMGPFAVPAPVVVRFRLVDVDDPSDDWPNVVTPFRAHLDEKDYAPRGEAPFSPPRGPRGGDNEGEPAVTPPWEEVSGFPILGREDEYALIQSAPLGPFLHEARVVLHCPSLAGDNFILEAEPVAEHAATFAARTGVITMWQRIDVALYKARDAFLGQAIYIREIFVSARVQLDFPEEAVEIDHEGPVSADGFAPLQTFFEKYDRHRGEPGWFAITFVKALVYEGQRLTTSMLVFDGNVRIEGAVPPPDAPPAQALLGQYVDVMLSPIPDGAAPKLTVEMHREGRDLTFRAQAVETLADGRTRIWLRADPLVPEPRAGTGAIEEAYVSTVRCLPTFHERDGVVLGAGFGFPEGADVPIQVFHAAETTTPATSSSIVGICGTRPVAGKEHFANYVFIRSHVLFSDCEDTAAHELGHAFGLPHRCGYPGLFGYQCSLGYIVDWTFSDESLSTLRPFPVQGSSREAFCAHHTKELRRTVLERNPAYLWVYKEHSA